MTTLADLKVGMEGYIEQVQCKEIPLRKHILDMGLTPGTEVTLIKTAPMGDPLELRVRGYELTLRKEDASYILLRDTHPSHAPKAAAQEPKEVPHPHTGEMGIYHVKMEGVQIPEGETITFGLAGNQNCGKTTLFNQLTGSNQHVGNFPGVTVDRKDGSIIGHSDTVITDLPGIYSMSPYSY